MNISALIIARNEQDKIEKTLKSLDFANETIIILDRSEDRTLQISRKYTSKIFQGSWESEGYRRNYGISKCKSDWILEIDADEVIGKTLAKEIIRKIQAKNADFYYIPLINYVGNLKIIFGWMACLAPDGKFCLFRKNKKKWLDGRVHPQYSLKGCKGSKFKNKIDHYMSKNLSELLIRFNRNTSLYATDLRQEKKSTIKLMSLRKIFSRFYKSYFSRKGFRAGGLGFFISILCAIYPIVAAIKSKYD